MDLSILSTIVSKTPPLQSVSLENLLLFFACTAGLKNDILLVQPSNHAAVTTPDVLPSAVQSFLSQACHMSPNTVTSCWMIFKDMVWQSDSVTALLRSPSESFQGYGHLHGLSKCSRTVPRHMPTIFPSRAHSVPARPVLHCCWLSTYVKGHADDARRAMAGRVVYILQRPRPCPLHSFIL